MYFNDVSLSGIYQTFIMYTDCCNVFKLFTLLGPNDKGNLFPLYKTNVKTTIIFHPMKKTPSNFGQSKGNVKLLFLLHEFFNVKTLTSCTKETLRTLF